MHDNSASFIPTLYLLKPNSIFQERFQKSVNYFSALSGMPSMNAFVVNAAVEKARQIIAQDQVLRLSENDAEMFIKALNQPPVVNTKLQEAAARYESMNQS